MIGWTTIIKKDVNSEQIQEIQHILCVSVNCLNPLEFLTIETSKIHDKWLADTILNLREIMESKGSLHGAVVLILNV